LAGDSLEQENEELRNCLKTLADGAELAVRLFWAGERPDPIFVEALYEAVKKARAVLDKAPPKD